VKNNEKFRVIVVLPVHPAGDIHSPTTKYIIKYTYKSISRQDECLFERLLKGFSYEFDISTFLHFKEII
jgi:hypothetical protein